MSGRDFGEWALLIVLGGVLGMLVERAFPAQWWLSVPVSFLFGLAAALLRRRTDE